MKYKIENNQLIINSQKIDLFSGEVHYWRVPSECWSDILDKVKETGLTTIASYIPWHYHELENKICDFNGQSIPNRNLKRFIELVKDKGLWLIARPGPYLYTEWVNRGVPDDLVPYHRNHPEFKKRAKKYIKEISNILIPYLITNKGNIVMVQADNEIDMWMELYEDDLGLFKRSGLFQDFLKEKYNNINELNNSWRSDLKSFDQASPVTRIIIDDPVYQARFKDFIEFRHYFSRTYASWVIEQYRNSGIDVPIYLNTYPWFESQNWSDFQNTCDLVGHDFYPVKEFYTDELKHRIFLDYIRFMRTFSKLPYIAEFECGVWQGYHYQIKVLTPNHYRLICISALQAGVVAWNWYMLVNRDNWYMSPINEYGRVRHELFPVFKRIVSLCHEMNPAECEKLVNTCVSFDTFDSHSEQFIRENPVFNALYKADIDYDLFNMETGNVKHDILYYSGHQYLSNDKQKRLLDYVESGGILVCFQDYPRLNEYKEPLNLLGIKDPERILGPHWLNVQLNKESSEVYSIIFQYDSVPGKGIKAIRFSSPESSLEEDILFDQLNSNKEYTIGYTQKKGKGEIMIVGVYPNPSIMKNIHDYYNIKISSQSPLENIITSFYKKNKEYYLLVTNNNNEEKQVLISLNNHLNNNKVKSAYDLILDKEIPAYNNDICVSVPRKDGTIVKIAYAY